MLSKTSHPDSPCETQGIVGSPAAGEQQLRDNSRSALEALRDSEQRYRMLFESLDEGFCVFDMLYDDAGKAVDYRFVEVNPAFEKHTGLADAAGKTILEMVPGHEKYWFEIYGKVAATGEPIRFKQRGEEMHRWFDVYAFRVGTADSRRVAALFSDVTERQKGEEALVRLAAIVESTDDAIVGKDLDGVITSWNAGAKRLFGYTAQEAIGQCVTILMPPDRVDEEPGILARIRRGERIDHYESVRQRKDGSLLDVSLTISPVVDTQGVVIGASKIARDITERKRHETQLMELNRTLERRVAKRTTQLQALAHQLTQVEWQERSRLARALHDGLQQLLVAATFRLRRLESKVDHDGLSDIVGQVNDLINQSIEMSRSLTTQLSPPILHERGLAAGLEWLARWMRNHHALEVTLETDPEAEPQTEEVRLLLFEAARELLFNVAKHAQTDRATLTMGRVDRQWVSIVVADQGAGFDPDHISYSDEGLTGFGLMSIRERLGYIGGNMEIKSQVGQGSQMSLIAPRCKKAQLRTLLFPRDQTNREARKDGQPKTAVSHPPALGRPIRVLLADDHQILREGLAGLLEEEPNIEVIGEASDGVAAVEMALRLKPDVVVMDITMPRMNGIEATRRIKEKEPVIRIVGLSMHAKKDIGHALREAGGEAYITKGGPAEDLIHAIEGG